jgi:hypothetical protein
VETNARALEQVVVTQRRELGRNLDALQDEARALVDEAKALVDWRQQFRKHTGATLAVAATVGVVVGMATAPRRRHQRPLFAAPAAAPEPVLRRATNVVRAIDPQDRAGRAVGELRDGVVDALVGLASAKAAELLGRVLPGFNEQVVRGRGYSGSR